MSYRVGIDVGGTFTDLALSDTDSGELIVTKAPSTPRTPRGRNAVIAKAQIEPSAIDGLDPWDDRRDERVARAEEGDPRR